VKRRRRAARRLLGLLALVVLLELSLQAASPIVRAVMLRRPPLQLGTAPLTILCTGDSNTYGLYVPSFSYPEQLRARLTARFQAPVEVVNRGVPGQSSAQVAAELPAELAAVRPDLVLLLAGANDAWNPAGDDSGFPLWEHLRLVRWTRVLLAGVVGDRRFRIDTDASGEIVVDRGDGPVRVNPGGGEATREGAELAASLRSGLGRALEYCRDRGAVPVLMTYAEFEHPVYRRINAVIRQLAADRRVLLVDHEPAFAAAAEREGRDTLMFNDQHPNARGYALMARQVDAVLVQAGWIPPPAPQTGESPPTQAPLQTPVLSVLPDGTLDLHGPPGWAYQVAISRRPTDGAGFAVGPVRIPLARDGILIEAEREPGLSGRLDGEGQGRARVPDRLRRLANGAGLAACLVLLYPPSADNPAPVAAASAAVELPD